MINALTSAISRNIYERLLKEDESIKIFTDKMPQGAEPPFISIRPLENSIEDFQLSDDIKVPIHYELVYCPAYTDDIGEIRKELNEKRIEIGKILKLIRGKSFLIRGRNVTSTELDDSLIFTAEYRLFEYQDDDDGIRIKRVGIE